MEVSDVGEWIQENILASVVIALTLLCGVGGIAAIITGIVFTVNYRPYDEIFRVDNSVEMFLALGIVTICLGGLMCLGLALVFSVVKKDALCWRICFLFYLCNTVYCLLILFNIWWLKTMESENFTVKLGMDKTFNAHYLKNAVPVPTTTTLAPQGDKIEGENYRVNKPDKEEDILELRKSDFFDAMHKKLSCCGCEGPTDFKFFNRLPESCCKTAVNTGECHVSNAYQKGCKMALVHSLASDALVPAMIFGVFFIGQVLSPVGFSILVCTCCCPSLT